MFRHHGSSRSDRQNRLLAGYLAFIGGFVNSAGFFLIGTFTSHVTGNVGRFINDVVALDFHAALFALTMIVAFFFGAFVASMAVESSLFRQTPYAYAFTLASEAALLVVFILLARLTTKEHPRVQDAEAAILCAAMGMQNSLVTRLSGAVVRTTHLTGVVTDLGIEAARWFRWWRDALGERVRVRLAFGRVRAERPSSAKVALLGTIAGSFMLGAFGGGSLVPRLGHTTLLLPSLALLVSAVYAFRSGRVIAEPGSRA